MYKVIKKEIFKDGQLEETTFEIMKNEYYHISVYKKDWEAFKKAIVEVK